MFKSNCFIYFFFLFLLGCNVVGKPGNGKSQGTCPNDNQLCENDGTCSGTQYYSLFQVKLFLSRIGLILYILKSCLFRIHMDRKFLLSTSLQNSRIPYISWSTKHAQAMCPVDQSLIIIVVVKRFGLAQRIYSLL